MEKQIKVIICADDGEWSRENTDALASRGAQVVTVNRNGTALLTKIRDEKPDVVVMDPLYGGRRCTGRYARCEGRGTAKARCSSSRQRIPQTLWSGRSWRPAADYYAIQPFSKTEIIDRIFTLAGAAQHPSNGTSRSDLRIRSRRFCIRLACQAHIKGTTIFGIPSQWPRDPGRLSMR